MRILLVLIIVACCYQLSFIKTQKQFRTTWTSACYNGNIFIWNPKADFQINGSLFPHIEHIPFLTTYSFKRRSMIHALHATALRLLLLIAGDIEENPGPIDRQSASSTNQSVSTSGELALINHSEQDQSTSTGQSNERMKCSTCDKPFARKSDLMRHKRTIHGEQKFSCSSCHFKTNRKDSLERHRHKIHEAGPSKRRKIEVPLVLPKVLQTETIRNTAATADSATSMIIPKKAALKGELKVDQLQADEGSRDLELFLNNSVQEISNYVNNELLKRTGVKLLLNPRLEFFKPVHPEETTINYFSHKPIELFRGSNVYKDIQSAFPPILNAVEEFTREGSGWAIQKILSIDAHIARLGITRGSSYHKLPKELANKRAMVNVKNRDNKCFLWSILAKLHPIPGKNNPNRVSNYKHYEHELDFGGVDFPVKIKDIVQIERNNGLAINLYGYDDEVGLHPLRISKETGNRWIHLLLYEGHYSLIKNLDRLMFDQRGYKVRKYFCPRCLTPKYSEKDRKDHYDLCCQEEPTKIVMPADRELKFKNHKKMRRQPLVLYADFECLTEKIDGPRRGHTMPYQTHTPCGYGLMGIAGCCSDSKIGTPTIYRGEDCVKRFFTEIVGFAADHQQTLSEHEKIIDMTPGDWITHNGSGCHICRKQITWQAEPNDEIKVRDHCHFCGKYWGPAHRRCNRDYRKNRDIVVVIHNLRRYDTHLLMLEFGGAAKLHGWDLDVVAKTMEDYISFNLVHKEEVEEKKGSDELGDEPNAVDHSYKVKFIDSFQFMSRSLAELVNNLEKNQFHATAQEFSGTQLELLLRKGVYPYDYMDSWERFDERMIPRKRDFYSKLNDERVSDEDCRHVMEVWNKFGIRTLGDYHDLYLKTDVLLLADVFEEFRKIAIDAYGLDPCHYMTAPSLTWDACLKMTGIKLELVDDPDVYMFFEHGIRGGISQISHRHARANNRYLPDFDPSLPSRYIVYLDANNLYGYAMVQPMPVGGFKWMDKEEIEEICWSDVPDDWPTGYVLEVDLEYPSDLHDAHSSYPLAPEHMTITNVSPYCQVLREKLGLKTPPTRKLVTTLYGKKRYIIHYRNLKLYTKLGMRVTKVHKAICFIQEKWMEPYIMSNTQWRTVAKNAFEKDFYKLMNNAAFGKTMEDVRKYKNVELVTSDVPINKLVTVNWSPILDTNSAPFSLRI